MIVDGQEFCAIGIKVAEVRGKGYANAVYPIRPYIVETGAEIPVSAITIEESVDSKDVLRAQLTVYVSEVTHEKEGG